MRAFKRSRADAKAKMIARGRIDAASRENKHQQEYGDISNDDIPPLDAVTLMGADSP